MSEDEVFDLYDSCKTAIERADWARAISLAEQIKQWTFTDYAAQFDVTNLRSFTDMVVLVHGPKVRDES